MWILISKHYFLTLKSCGDWSVFLSVGVMCPCKRECIALGDGPSLLGMFSCFLLTIGSFGVWKIILDEAGKSLISRWREGTYTHVYTYMYMTAYLYKMISVEILQWQPPLQNTPPRSWTWSVDGEDHHHDLTFEEYVTANNWSCMYVYTWYIHIHVQLHTRTP